MTTPRPLVRRFALVVLLVTSATLTVACGTEEEDPLEVADTLDLVMDTEPDTAPNPDVAPETEVDVPTLTVVARDPSWTAPEMPDPCKVCSSCFSDSDCGAGESCIGIDGRSICTALCSSGACPGDSRCFDVSENGGRATAVCLNPTADTAFCDASWICGGEPPVDPDMDMDMDGGEYADPILDNDGYAVKCNTGQVCSYCGGPDQYDTSCPPSDPSEHCKVFRLVNEERGLVGLPPLTYNAELAIAAQLHAMDMAVCNYHEHDSLDGRDFADRELAAGYDAQPGGENIAAGQRSAEEVMEAWMNSQGHRENILRESFTEIGVGYYQGNPDGDFASGIRWVQNFGVR